MKTTPDRTSVAFSIGFLLVSCSLVSCKTTPSLPPGVSSSSPEGLYLTHCARCHAPERLGKGPERPFESPALNNADYLKNLGHPYLSAIITGGGEAVGRKKTMPGAKGISPEQVDALIAYILAGQG